MPCRQLEINCGGKGLNQSIALSKAGGDAYIAGAVSTSGEFLVAHCKANGVNVEHVVTSSVETGHAIIQVNEKGENCILLFGGANRQLQVSDIDKTFSHFGRGDVLILQNEINHLPYIMERAWEKGMRTVFNPSPFDESVRQYPLDKIDVLILNEIEGGQFTGKAIPQEMLNSLAVMYPYALIVLTLGADGILLKNKNRQFEQKAFKVHATDTTGAGDTFTGYFVSLLSMGKPLEECLALAAKASAIAVMAKGASDSIPVMEDVLKFQI